MDWNAYRTEFPVTEKYAYFQHPAVTALPVRAKQAIETVTGEMSEHGCLHASRWYRRLEAIRNSAAKLIGTTAARVGFVKSTSHGLSVIASAFPWKTGDSVAVPEDEFPANVYPWAAQQNQGVDLQRVPLTADGRVTLDNIRKTLDDTTRVLSVSSVQFHNGFRADLEAIGELCAARNVELIVDGIQSLGWDPLDIEALPLAGLVADGHKWLCGPEGVGLIYLSEKLQQRLQFKNVGWNSVRNPTEFSEEDFTLKNSADVVEEGSANTIGTYGFGASLELLLEIGLENIRERNLALTKIMETRLKKLGCKLIGDNWAPVHNSPILSFHHPDHNSEKLQQLCADNNIQLSLRNGQLRVGLHFYNNRADIDKLIETLASRITNQ